MYTVLRHTRDSVAACFGGILPAPNTLSVKSKVCNPQNQHLIANGVGSFLLRKHTILFPSQLCLSWLPMPNLRASIAYHTTPPFHRCRTRQSAKYNYEMVGNERPHGLLSEALPS